MASTIIYPGEVIQVVFRWNNGSAYTMNPQFKLQIKGSGFDWIGTDWVRLGPVAANTVSGDREMSIQLPEEWNDPGAKIEVEVKFRDGTFGIGEKSLHNFQMDEDVYPQIPDYEEGSITIKNIEVIKGDVS